MYHIIPCILLIYQLSTSAPYLSYPEVFEVLDRLQGDDDLRRERYIPLYYYRVVRL